MISNVHISSSATSALAQLERGANRIYARNGIVQLCATTAERWC